MLNLLAFLVAALLIISATTHVAARDLSAAASLTSPDAFHVRHKIERLFILQDQAAQGSASALEGQKQMLQSISKLLSAVPEHDYPMLVSSVAAYVLSGGDPETAKRASKVPTVSEADRRLLLACAQFMTGQHGDEVTELPKLDPNQLPHRLGGRIALVQALMSKESARDDRFMLAMSLMPGTLIEESALRRSTIDLAERRMEREMWARLHRYVRRFGTSIYAPAFWREIVGVIATGSSKGWTVDIASLDRIISPLPMNQRRIVYRLLAKGSAVVGSVELANSAGRRLVRLSQDGSVESQWGRFYRSLYGIVSPDGDSAMRILMSMPRNTLDPEENALLDAALALRRQIEKPPTLQSPGFDEPVSKSQLEVRGDEALSISEALLSRSAR